MVLAGGTGRRLGGADKASIEVQGRSLLEHAITATTAAHEVVIVAARQVPTSRAVTWTLEEPSDGGPAAGLLAGLDALPVVPDLVCALAVDMPGVTRSTVSRLLDAVDEDDDAAVLVDRTGRLQPLAGVYRFSALTAARPAPGLEHGLSMRALLAPMHVKGVAAVGNETLDVDTWADLRRLR